MIKSIVKILLLLIWILVSCNKINKPKEQKLKEVSKVNEEVINKNKQNYVINKKRIEAKGIYSYLSQDTFYIISRRDSLIIKRYLKLAYNLELKKKMYEMCDIEQERKDNYLFVSLYFGDAIPYQSFLLNLKLRKIIIENDYYQTYLGCSANGLYHLFEGGTSGGVRGFAVYSAKNILLKESLYYSAVKDKNQLKWKDNKFYYYCDIQEGFVIPDSIPKITKPFIYVQKYEWNENINSVLGEFKETMIE